MWTSMWINLINVHFLPCLLNRNVLVVVSVAWEFWTHTGLPKTHHTNISKLFSLIQLTTQSVVIQKSTGFAKQFRNIVNCVVSHQPAKAHVVLAKDIVTLKPLVVHVVLHGAAETVFICAESVKLIVFYHRTEITFDGIDLICMIFRVLWIKSSNLIFYGKINFLKMKL